MIVAKEAIEDAKLVESKVNNDKVGVIWGAGIGGLETFQNEVLTLQKVMELKI